MANDGATTIRACEHCGQPLPETANFCAECGMRVGPAPARPPDPPPAAKTLLNFRAPAASAPSRDRDVAQPGPSTRDPSTPGELAAGTSRAPIATTMLGLPAAQAAAAQADAAPPFAPAAGAHPIPPRTMLGVARPGIAPLHPGDAPLPRPNAATAAAPAQGAAPAKGVAPPSSTPAVGHSPGDLPGRRPAVGEVAPDKRLAYAEAPTSPALAPAIVPRPEPLPDLPTPVPPRIAAPRGIPLTAAALAAGALVLVLGASIAWLWKAAPPIVAEPVATPEGRDVLRLHCAASRCPDSTIVETQDARASFKGGDADLLLQEPLRIGPNTVAVRLERPGSSRAESLSISVPLTYRVRADVTPMSGPAPSVVVRAEALPGSEVTVDGRPLSLDADGRGAYAIDESRATEGPADESRIIAVDVPYTVLAPGPAPNAATPAPARGTVSARVTVAPLRVDAPGPHAVIETDHVLVAGRAARGAAVTIDGTAVSTSADGLFEKTIDVPDLGERRIEVRSGSSILAARTVHFAVRRVARLAAAAKEYEARPSLGYDAAMRDLAGSAGKPILVDGEVIDARAAAHRTIVLIDDHRGCGKGPCLARVVLAQDLAVIPSTRARAFGRVAGPYTTSPGHTVPEVEADFIVQGPR